MVPVWALEEPAGRPDAGAPRAPQPPFAHRDADLDVEFSMAPGPNGGAEVRLVSGPLSVVKTIRSDGSTVRVVTWRQDTVRITNDATGVVVERNGRRAAWRASDVSDAAVDTVRSVLAESPAIRALRRLGAVLEQRGGEDSAFTVSTLMDSAFVALLDGDGLAVRRFGERMAERGRARSRRGAEGLVPVSLNLAPRSRVPAFRDCLGELYDYIGRSWGQYRECEGWALDDPWYQRGLHIMWCQREFEIRMASGLLQFVDCSAFPD